jgi:hypothetical protein
MPITQNEAVDDRVVRFMADLLVKMVGGEVSVPQATQMVNTFSDSLRGMVPDDQWADARTHMMNYVSSAQNTMQAQERAEELKNGESSDLGTKAAMLALRDGLLDSTLTLAQAMGVADEFADTVKKLGMPEDQLFQLKAHLSSFLLACEAEKEQRDVGIPRIVWHDEVPADPIKDLWQTIRAYIQAHLPAMIDTPEKERSVARRVGFLCGYYGERTAAGVLRMLGVIP